MDRRAGVVALVLAACAGGPRSTARTTVVARGTLAYAVAFCGDRLATIELGERFELVVRRGDGGPPLARADLGPPELDWTALACDATRAWVGGETGEVRGFELASGADVARWPVGAPVTSVLFASGGSGAIAIADASGVLCLRRRDGALLQCVAAHDGAIAALELDGERLISRDRNGAARGWTLPSLASSPPRVRERRSPCRPGRRSPPRPADRRASTDECPTATEPAAAGPRWQGDRVRAVGRRVERLRGRGWESVATLAGTVRGIAVGPAGTLAIAAWIGSLDDASVVLIRPGRQ